MQDITFKEEQQIELKRMASGMLAYSLTNLCSPQMIECLRKINEFQISNQVIGFETRFGISYKRFLDEIRNVLGKYESWRFNFPFEFHEWKENLSAHLKENKMILPDYLSFESWFDAYHETVLGLMPYQIITTKINSYHFKLYSEYQAIIFNGLTEEQAILKQRNTTLTTSPEAKEQTFESIFPSDEDKEMVMSLLKGLKIINSAGDYLLGKKTGMIRVFIEVMKEEGCFVDIENKKILRLFTPVILGRKVLTIKEPVNYGVMKKQILKKYAELKK